MTIRACRAAGCAGEVSPGQSWCHEHRLAPWEQMPQDLRERFATRMVAGITTNESGCWLFAGTRNSSGYAVTELLNRRVLVHRWMYWYLKGPLLPDHELHHVCGGADEQNTRHCIRPAHLIQVRREDHRDVTTARTLLLAEAEAGARFYPTAPGETGATVEFARAHDLPRHEVARMDPATSADGAVTAIWKLLIPARFQSPQ